MSAPELGLIADDLTGAMEVGAACRQADWHTVVLPRPDVPVPLSTAQAVVINTDVVMFHDQGHIPMKLLSFETGVNVTIGLPIIRTSVDHGTAFDIAWQGKAFIHSLQHALDYARKLVYGG